MAMYAPHKDGLKTQAGIPCVMAIDFKPRGGKLYMTVMQRSQATSKSGYNDAYALVGMGKYICDQVNGLELEKITCVIASAHLRTQNNELKNCKNY